MTRDEAIEAIHRAHHPEDFKEGPHSSIRLGGNLNWAAKAVDGYVALGILKLDEPKSVPEKLRSLSEMAKNLSLSEWKDILEAAGLRIVEK